MSSLLLATVVLATVYGALWHNQPARRRNSGETEEEMPRRLKPRMPFLRNAWQQAKGSFRLLPALFPRRRPHCHSI